MHKQTHNDNATAVEAHSNPIHSDSLPVPKDIRRVPEFVEFARWFALPSHEREPETQKEFAEAIGVSQDTLTDWKKRPEFWQLTSIYLREWMRERTPDVIGGLFNKITDGKGGAGDVKFFLGLSEWGPPLK